MYALNGRVNDLYFGILMLDEQLAQNALLQDELGRNFRQITAYVENGIANQADLDAVKVEQLNTRQKRVELTFSRMAYLKMLSLLMGEVLSPETVLRSLFFKTNCRLSVRFTDRSCRGLMHKGPVCRYKRKP